MVPRIHYLEISRELAKIDDPRASAGVRAINDLLEERARLARQANRVERNIKPVSKSWFKSWFS